MKYLETFIRLFQGFLAMLQIVWELVKAYPWAFVVTIASIIIAIARKK